MSTKTNSFWVSFTQIAFVALAFCAFTSAYGQPADEGIGAQILSGLTEPAKPRVPWWSLDYWPIWFVAFLCIVQAIRKNFTALQKLWLTYKNRNSPQPLVPEMVTPPDDVTPAVVDGPVDAPTSLQSMVSSFSSGTSFFLRSSKATQRPIKWLVILIIIIFVVIQLIPFIRRFL